MHICCGTKGSEVTDRRFAAMPRFKRSLMRESRGGRGVVDFNKCHSSFTPECEREVCICSMAMIPSSSVRLKCSATPFY